MSAFSERLDEIVRNAGYTKYGLAKLAEIDRTTLLRAVDGKRVPGDDYIRKLSVALRLPKDVENELLDLAEEARDGSTLFGVRRNAMHLIESMAALELRRSGKADSISRSIELSDVVDSGLFVCEGSIATKKLVKDTIEAVYFNNSSSVFRLCCPFEFAQIFNTFIYLIDSDNNGPLIKHLVAMQPRTPSSMGDNIATLSKLLPLAVQCYRFYQAYYIPEAKLQNGIYTAFPYYLIAGNMLIFIADDFSSSMLISEEKAVELMKKRFDAEVERAVPVTITFNEIIDIVNAFYGIINSNDDMTSLSILQYMPGVCNVFSGERIVEQRIRGIPEIEMVIKPFCDGVNNIHNGCAKDIVQYFTLDGIDSFLHTGYTAELPREFVNPFSMEARLEFLEKIVELVKASDRFYAIDKYSFKVPMNCNIRHMSGSFLNFAVNNINTCSTRMVNITEESVIAAFDDFFKYLPSSRFVLPKDETIKQLEQRVVGIRSLM